MRIDRRLAAVSDALLRGQPTADIGADHALLSIYIIEKGIVPKVIIGELNAGPFTKANNAVASKNLTDKIEVRQGSGLQILGKAEVGNIIIAGMGGETMVDILAFDWEKARSFPWYIFQPMSRPEALRRELAMQGWPIIDESLVKENDRYYAIICCCPGNQPYRLSALQLEMGPVILKSENKLKKDYIQKYLKKYYTIYNSLKKSSGAKKGLLIGYERMIMELEGILNAGEN